MRFRLRVIIERINKELNQREKGKLGCFVTKQFIS